MKGQIINLGDGVQDDLEWKLYEYMVALAKSEGIEWAVENAWGENTVVIGGVAYEVQWQFVGLENTDYELVQNKETGQTDYIPVGEWFWEYDDAPDFEVSSYWREQ